MNTNEILNKLEALEKSVKDERQSLVKSIIMSGCIYGFLVILVFGYTSYITVMYHNMATPKTVAVILTDMAKKRIPLMKDYLKEHSKKQAPVWAHQGIKYLHSRIPLLEKVAKQQIDNIVEKVIQHTKDQYIPQLHNYVKGHLDSLFKHADVVSDHKLAVGIAHLLVDEINNQLSSIIHEKFFTKIRELRKEVEIVAAKPKKKLTKKEDAERRVLLYWMFLVKYGDPGHSKIINTMRFFTSIFEGVIENYSPPIEIKHPE